MKNFEKDIRKLRKDYPNNQEFGDKVNEYLIKADEDKKEADKERNKPIK